jgi:hypothetical protein
MKKQTALQIAMRITQRYANSLFDEHTARGRQFMQEMSECLEQEREQIEQAFNEEKIVWVTKIDDDGRVLLSNEISYPNGEAYYNETYKGGENE